MMADGLGVRRRWAHHRERFRERRLVNLGYRLVVGVVGLLVLVVGIVAIPYPGPGWAIVFVGLAILATEFEWARKSLAYTRVRYDAVMGWFRQQGLWVQAAGVLFTLAIVLVSLWMLGVLGWAGELLNIGYEWLYSPIGFRM